MTDLNVIRDTLVIAMDMARDLAGDRVGIIGYGIIELRGPDGELKQCNPFANKVTDTGDLYYATQAIYNVPPANGTGAATKLAGMQIGSGVTAEAKSGAGAAMVTYLYGQAFDATWPKVNNLGAGLGCEAEYKTTYAAGVGTGTVQEATLTWSSPITTASTTANTVGRILTGAVAKAAGDSLAITWKQKFLGA